MWEVEAMSKTIFDKDEHTTTVFEESANKVTLTKWQDAKPILEQNARERNSGTCNPARTALGRKVASIPLVTWQNWMKETNGDIQKDPTLLAKYLNDPDNAFLRTHNSRI